MTLSARRAAAIKLLAELDQDEWEAAEIADDPASSKAQRFRAKNYREHFRAGDRSGRTNPGKPGGRPMSTPERIVKKLVNIAENVALEECEAVGHGQEPCPLQYDDQEEWCLACLAKRAIEEFNA